MARETVSFVGRAAFLLGAAIPAPATAQLYGSFLNDIHEQPPRDTIKAQADHAGRKPRDPASKSTEATGDSISSNEPPLPARSDDFAGKNVPTYRLQNGVTLQVSGGFHPSDTARCVSDCFVPLQSPHRYLSDKHYRKMVRPGELRDR